MKKALFFSVIIILLEFILIAAMYGRLPDQIPTHWNAMGEVDGYGSRSSIFLFPAISVATTIWLYFMPHLVPKGENIKKSGKSYYIIMVMLNLLMALILLLTIGTALGVVTSTGTIIPVATGILLMCVGNYLPKIKPNYSFGIRVPWTLANEFVWIKTHRVGGKVFMGIGLLFVVGALLPPPLNIIIPLGGLIVGSILITLYSYIIYRNI